MHSLTDSDTVAYSRSYGICITKAIKQTRTISRSHLIAFSQFFNCLFSVGNRKKLKSGRLDLLFLQRGTLQYTMLTFSVRTNLATVGHVTFVPYDGISWCYWYKHLTTALLKHVPTNQAAAVLSNEYWWAIWPTHHSVDMTTVCSL